MTNVVINYIRRGSYLDSVALMQFSKDLLNLPGVNEAAIMMGTPANLQIMADAELLDENTKVDGGDMVIAVSADTRANAENGIELAKELLRKPKTKQNINISWKPKTLSSAVANDSGVNFVLISVPGEFAAAEARKAIRRGLHVMMFSDNVSLEEEKALKIEARSKNCLMMGPDCGTAILNGVPLAFANNVPRGDIGIVGASGTGIQEVSTLIARHGGGISHAIGVGGRDLKSEIGGITTLMALDVLEKDSSTRHIIIISKPPSPGVVEKVLEKVNDSRKTFTICFIGMEACDVPHNAKFAPSLKASAELALNKSFSTYDIELRSRAESVSSLSPSVCGLYSGGTLCAEAQVCFREASQNFFSNAPIPGGKMIGESNEKHSLIDLGADEYTKGKPHPMIDPSIRDNEFDLAMSNDNIGIILFDVVIGFGSHSDPAGHMLEFLENYIGNKTILIGSVTGTDDDPQIAKLQIAKLKKANVYGSATDSSYFSDSLETPRIQASWFSTAACSALDNVGSA